MFIHVKQTILLRTGNATEYQFIVLHKEKEKYIKVISNANSIVSKEFFCYIGHHVLKKINSIEYVG